LEVETGATRDLPSISLFNANVLDETDDFHPYIELDRVDSWSPNSQQIAVTVKSYDGNDVYLGQQIYILSFNDVAHPLSLE
jgi:hypothetical protein